MGVIHFDWGKKKKKRSNLISPPGTLQAAGARDRRETEVAAASSKSKGRHGHERSEELGAVTVAHKHRAASGV